MLQLIQDLRSDTVEVVELPDPVPSRNEVLVRNHWSVISPGTEQSLARTAGKSIMGKALDRPDQVRQVIDKVVKDGVTATAAAVRARLDDVLTPGYSCAGVVEAMGPGASGLSVGDLVGCVGANAACHAERVVVPAPLTFRLPPDLASRFGAFGALGAIAGHGVRLGRIGAGSIVAVIGLGLVGQLAVQLASGAGARVIAIDVVARNVERALEHGAVGGAVLGADDAQSVVRAKSDGNGADAVVITAATNDSGPIELAAELARDRATISVVGDVGLQVPRRTFYEKELELRISRSYGPGRYDDAYERLGHDYPIGYVRWTERRLIEYFFGEVVSGRVRLDPLITHEFAITEGQDAYRALDEPGRLAIMLRYDAPQVSERRVTLAYPAGVATGRSTLRVGVIGPGLFARSTLLPQLAKLNDVDLAGVVGRSSAQTFGVARRWGAALAATEAAALLRDPEVDAVVIATRHDSHAELAAQALDAGKGAFLEKPLAIDEAGLERLKPFLADGAHLVVDFNRSIAPLTQRLVGHFAARADPLSISFRINAGFLEPDHWLRDPAIGGGRLVGEACHFVDFCSTVVARRLESVQVTPLGPGATTLSGDNFVLSLGYEDGSVATITYVGCGHPRLAKERVEVLGSGRSAVIDDFRRLELFPRSGGLGERMPRARDKGHGAMLAAAARFFRDGGAPPVPYERLVATTRATLAARAALGRGERAPVPIAP
jgi:predicted dehydrogenase/threonine dehydrogenase-like Zn-dependent dehydrogenase